MIELNIGKNDASLRADRFLLKATTAPSSLIYKAFRKKDVKINGKWVREDYILKENDVLRIFISDEFIRTKKSSLCALTCPVVYEDSNIIIFDKPASLPSQSDKNHKGGTLSEMLKGYLALKGEYDPESEKSFSPALCNRLDTNTRGLCIGAKNREALRDMNMLIRDRKVKKYYTCIVEGIPEKSHDKITGFIKKDEEKNKSYITDDGGKEIKMEYRVISSHNGESKVSVLLETGRSHQIRAYFSSIGCPLKGDKKYGALKGGGQCLVSDRLAFDFGSEYKGILSYLDKKKIKLFEE